MASNKRKASINAYLLLGIVLMGAILVGILSENLDGILYEPLRTPDTWFENHPYMEIGNTILSEPSSTAIVLLLTILTLWVGVLFIRTQNDQPFRFWWGLSLILTGIGAGLAGISYQAFAFVIKCSGYEYCVWTSWWEVTYMICTVAGVGAAFMGIAYLIFSGKAQKYWSFYALASTFIYVIVVLIGTILPNRFLVSFELMVMFISIGLLAISIQCLWHYHEKKNPYILNILRVGVAIAAVIAVYFIALISDFASILWDKGIWFNENDVLHVLMIGWVLFVYKVLGKNLKDISNADIMGEMGDGETKTVN